VSSPRLEQAGQPKRMTRTDKLTLAIMALFYVTRAVNRLLFPSLVIIPLMVWARAGLVATILVILACALRLRSTFANMQLPRLWPALGLVIVAYYLGAPWYVFFVPFLGPPLARTCAAVVALPWLRFPRPRPRVHCRHARTQVRRGDWYMRYGYPLDACGEYRAAIAIHAPLDTPCNAWLRLRAAEAAHGVERNQEALDYARDAQTMHGSLSDRARRNLRARALLVMASAYGELGNTAAVVDALSRARSDIGYSLHREFDERWVETVLMHRDPVAAERKAIRRAAMAACRLSWLNCIGWLILTAKAQVRESELENAGATYGLAGLMTDKQFRYRPRRISGRWRRIWLPDSEIELALEEIELKAGKVSRPQKYGSGGPNDPADPEIGYAETFRSFGKDLLASRAYLVSAKMASLPANNNSPQRSLRLSLHALTVIEKHRYDLRSQNDRVNWLKAHREAHQSALFEAQKLEQTELVLGLIEIGWLQGRPIAGLTGPILNPPDSVAAAFLSVGEIPVKQPPAVKLRNDAWLQWLAGPARDAGSIDLDEARVTAGGHGAVRLSWWANDDGLYWGLLWPGGSASGRLIVTDTPVGNALVKLSKALPKPIGAEVTMAPKERRKAVEARTAVGPFWVDRNAEAELAEELGRALLPAPLLRMLAAVDPRAPLSLVVTPAPDSVLTGVPWPLLIVPGRRRADETPYRLIELATLRLGPTAAQLADLARRPPLPQRSADCLAVLDPSGNGSTRLEHARELAIQLRGLVPPENILGGVWLDSNQPPTTRSVLSDRLRAFPHTGILVMAAHSSPPPPGAGPSGTSIPLAVTPDAENSSLSATDLLNFAPQFPFPTCVILAACDTIGATYAALGEWLTLAPAVLWAGADNVIATTTQISDKGKFDYRLLKRLIERPGGDVARILREVQLDYLRSWRSGDMHARPLSWAFYHISGRSVSRTQTKPYEMPKPAPEPVFWTADAAQALLDARRELARLRKHVVQTSVLAVAGSTTEMFRAMGGLPSAIVGTALLGLGLARRWHEPATLTHGLQGPLPSDTLLSALRAAEEIARNNGRTFATYQDLILGILAQKRSPGAKMLRLLPFTHRADFTERMHRLSRDQEGKKLARPPSFGTNDETARSFLEYCFGSLPTQQT